MKARIIRRSLSIISMSIRMRRRSTRRIMIIMIIVRRRRRRLIQSRTPIRIKLRIIRVRMTKHIMKKKEHQKDNNNNNNDNDHCNN